MNRHKKFVFLHYVLIAVTVLMVSFGVKRHVLAATTVATEAQLQTALNNGETDIVLGADITLTNQITVTGKHITLISDSAAPRTLSNGNGLRTMFAVNNGASVVATNVIFDGNNQGRLFMVENNAKLSLTKAVVKNGTTQLFEEQVEEGINKQRYQGGGIYALNATLEVIETDFINNTTKTDTPDNNDKQAGSPHGAAIYITDRSTLKVRGGSFKHNLSGRKKSVQGQSHGEGGAIKSEGSTLVIEPTPDGKRTLFLNNNTYMTSASGGFQGGSIEATGSIVTITDTDFKFDGENQEFAYRGGFSTGGFIKFEGSTGKVTGSTFTFHKLADGFGIAAGAIASESSHLTIDRSNFNAVTGGSAKIIEAGGFITIYGNGSFKLLNSMMTGTGSSWNGPRLATYGGAIAFYNNANISDAVIDNTLIRHVAADHIGGAIAISTPENNQSYFGKDTARVHLTLSNSIVDSTRSYWWNGNGRGGAVYVGPSSDEKHKNTLLVTKTQLRNNFANYGGAIYNDGGAVTLTDNSVVSNDLSAFNLGGYVYNNGYLKLDKVDMSASTTVGESSWSGVRHIAKPAELAGTGVYAKKDVIVTPEANLGSNDIRVLDNQSSVHLTGPLTRQLNISVSEVAKADPNVENNEEQYRHIGYIVAKGIDGYVPTVADAQMTHYKTKLNAGDTTGIYSQTVAEFNDHTSPAKWDYVLNPDTNNIVLGQRGLLVYHTNHKDATIANGQADDIVGQKVEQLYTFYESSGSVQATPAELTPIADKPLLAGYTFRNWYQHTAKEHPIYEKANDALYQDFSLHKFTTRANVNGVVTTILNADIENTIHAYAAYEKFDIEVVKTWIDNNNEYGNRPNEITVHLLANGKKIQTVTLTADKQWKHTFTNLEKVDNTGKEIVYSIQEDDMPNYIGEVISNGQQFTLKNTAIAPVSVKLMAKKELTGKVLATNQFSFELKQGNIVIDTVKNTADGKVIFKALTFTKAGTYYYTLQEINDKQDNVTYDTTVKSAVVTVVREGNQFVARVLVDGGISEPVFKNTYVPPITETTSTERSTRDETSESSTTETSTTESKMTEQSTESTTKVTIESTTIQSTTVETSSESSMATTTLSETSTTQSETSMSSKDSTLRSESTTNVTSTLETFDRSTTTLPRQTNQHSTVKKHAQSNNKTLPHTASAEQLSLIVAGIALISIGIISRYQKDEIN